MSSQPFKFDLGQEVKDIVSGFTGIVRSRSQWLTGCNTYGIASRELKDGKPQDPVWFDEHILEATGGEGVKPAYSPKVTVATEQKKRGGPTTPVGSTRSEQKK